MKAKPSSFIIGRDCYLQTKKAVIAAATATAHEDVWRRAESVERDMSKEFYEGELAS